MTIDPLDELLDRLNDGNLDAAEQVFRACEPLLRKVVRRLLLPSLRPKFDSSDVVQSVWADVIEAFQRGGNRFVSAEHLRAFLVKATKNRFIDLYRRHHRALEREEPLPGFDLELPASLPQPSDAMQEDDLWDKLLALCPPEHHELLRLKREGRPLAEIAARTGLHEGSIRRIVRALARQLAAEHHQR
ncbi:MAG: RNA polymerase sigma factor [Gemmataceae bacterium]|nr:RNA polymerase sigma factor [Gemmataceae bacterium]